MVYETAKLLIGETIIKAEMLVDQGGDFGLILWTKSGKIYSTVEGTGVVLISDDQYQNLKKMDKEFYD